MFGFQFVVAFTLFQGSARTEPKSDGLFWLLIVLAFLIGVTVGIIITETFNIIRKSISKSDSQQQQPTAASKTVKQEPQQKKSHVSLCPVCHTSYTDPNLRYCLSDGTLLFLRPQDKSDYDSEATLVSPKI